MSEIVKKAARALEILAAETCDLYEGEIDGTWDPEKFVRAVLFAFYEPTEAMIVAGCRHENMGDMAGRWRAMIDAALK